MNKLYLFVFFIGFSLSAIAQNQKPSEQSPTYISDILKAKVIKFYPNPAREVINFEFLKPVQNNLTLQVYNFVGKKMYELPNVSQKTSVSLNDFYRGMYIFQLKDQSGRIVESGKFQVAK